MTKFNEVVLDSLVKVEDIRLDIMPPIDVPMSEGINRSYAGAKKRSPRMIEIDIRIIETNHQTVVEKAKELAKVLYVEKNAKLITRRRPSEFIMAQPTGDFPLDQFLHTGGCTIVFVSDEGIYYSETVYQNLASGNNKGSLPAKPVLKFTANSATRTITSGTTTINLEGLTSGMVVEIDTETGKITANGATGNQFELITSRADLFELPVGTWSLTGATATYRERSL